MGIGERVRGFAEKVADGVMSGLDLAKSVVDNVTPDNVNPFGDVPSPDDVIPSGGGGDAAPGALVDPETIGVVADALAFVVGALA